MPIVFTCIKGLVERGFLPDFVVLCPDILSPCIIDVIFINVVGRGLIFMCFMTSLMMDDG